MKIIICLMLMLSISYCQDTTGTKIFKNTALLIGGTAAIVFPVINVKTERKIELDSSTVRYHYKWEEMHTGSVFIGASINIYALVNIFSMASKKNKDKNEMDRARGLLYFLVASAIIAPALGAIIYYN